MNTRPFSFADATFLCNYYQHLLRTTYREDTFFGEIENVVVLPYEQSEKEHFIVRYQAGHDPHKALDAYRGVKYDVLVIIRSYIDKDLCMYLPITEYLKTCDDIFEKDIPPVTFSV